MPQAGAVDERIARRVRARVAAHPDDPVAWRMFGKVLLLEGDFEEARAALARAVQLDPLRVAAHFDLAEAHAALGKDEQAAQSYARVVELSPGSEDAQQALRRLEELKAENPFRFASFEPRWTETVELGAERSAELATPDAASPLTWRLESGVLYNSNVDLAPISRELSVLENSGFQVFVEPSAEYAWRLHDHFYAGAALESYFTINEPDNVDFNLQHYQPGVYVEFPFWTDSCEIVPRLSYDFSYDIFAGSTLGTRHALTGSLASYADDGGSWIIFGTADSTDFRDDGADPTVSSLDGPTYTCGIVRSWAWGGGIADVVRLSFDGQWADLRGSDFAYRGGFALFSATCPLSDDYELRPEIGWGFREYPDFTGSPSRDESIWRAGTEMRRWWGDRCYFSASFYYDRFDSENANFAAERYTTGISATLLR